MRIVLLLALASLTGCTHWTSFSVDRLGGLDERTRVQLWVGQERYDLHDVEIRQDSLFATPSWQPTDCVSCRLAFATTVVDSVNKRAFSETRTSILGVILGSFLVVFATAMSELRFN